MPRPLLAAAAAATLVLASCGNDSASPAPGPATPVSGTVLGQAFTASDASALVLGRATCDFGGTAASATGLLLGFGTFQGLCSFVTQHQACATKASATIVTVVVVRANVAPGGTAGPVPAGTYTVSAATPTPDAQGNVTVVQAIATRTDATCGNPAGDATATGGTVRIAAVGARVSGSVDLTFSDGGRVTGPFDVPACGFQTDVCTVLSGGGCTSEPCVP